MEYEVEVERMAYGPEAIAHLPGNKVVFVEGGAPGDRARITITADKKTFARATIAELIDPSPMRVEPLSLPDLLGKTAPWQYLSYECQLQSKRQNVIDALTRIGHRGLEEAERIVAPCLPSKRQWNYRNKLELGCGEDPQGRLIVGFHGNEDEGRADLIPIESSHLVHKAIEKAPRSLRGALRFAQGSQDLGIYRIGVRHSLATGDKEIALWTPPGAFPRHHVAQTLEDALKPTSIVRVLADPGKARKIKGIETLAGRGNWRERIGRFDYSTQAPSFFQVNTAQAEKLIDLVLEGLGDIDGAFVVDLYAGGGTFSIPLAAAGADVVAVEAAGSSVKDLRSNAEANDVDIDVIGGDAARELASLGDVDCLVVDPPRAGLAPEAIDAIEAASPEILAYVSCDPASWARDVELLEARGYSLLSATPVDMFPQTYHVEIVSIFRRK